MAKRTTFQFLLHKKVFGSFFPPLLVKEIVYVCCGDDQNAVSVTLRISTAAKLEIQANGINRRVKKTTKIN